MTTVTGAIRPRTEPREPLGTSTPISAEGPDFATAYRALQELVPADHLLLYLLVD